MNIDQCYLDLIEVCQNNANPDRAIQMKRYMKGHFKYFGIPAPKLKKLLTNVLAVHKLGDVDEAMKLVYVLWEAPERELQYAAMQILAKRERKLTKEHFDDIVYLISTKSWWDTVDWLAGHGLGEIFKKSPELIDQCYEDWMNGDNMWLQRSLLLFQLFYRDKTDIQFIFKTILRLKNEQDFFIRKAAGWALRQYSKTDGDIVKKFVQDHPELSTLTKNEALKWLNKH